jgi:sugar/nucleoside kinase (ribokinase family)
MSTEIDVLVLGGAGVDTIVHVPELPVPFADSHMIRPGIVTRAGQSGDFVALGTSALGLRTHHLDLLGDDPEGDLVRALHREHGIGLTAVPQPLGTKRAVNLVGPDGRRSSLYDATRAADTDRLPEATVRALAAVSRHAHVVITQPCAHTLPALRASGLTISTDLHDWDGDNPYHEPFAHQADLVFLSTTALTDPERTMRRITDRGKARIVVATAGADGGVPAGRRGAHPRARRRAPGPRRRLQRRGRRLRRRVPLRLAERHTTPAQRPARHCGRRLRLHDPVDQGRRHRAGGTERGSGGAGAVRAAGRLPVLLARPR